MDDKDGAVIETKRLAGVIVEAMATASRFLESDERPDEADLDCMFKRKMLYECERRFRTVLMDSLWAVKRRWNEIIGNKMLLEDLQAYLNSCRDFSRAAWEFDALVHRRSRRASDLFGTSEIGRWYLSDIIGWETEAKSILDYQEKNMAVGARLDDVFANAARRLAAFCGHVSARSLKGFVMNGVSLKDRPIWSADKRQAIVMGKMLGKSCREMNESFTFTTQDGNPTKLSYSGHGPVLEFNQYEIYNIMSPLVEAVND